MPRLNRLTSIVIASVIVSCTLLALFARPLNAASPPTTRPTSDEEVRTLRARVAELESLVAAMQKELDVKEKIIERQHRQLAVVPRIIPPLGAAPPASGPFRNPGLLAVPLGSPPPTPREWVPQQFNGSTFYLV